VREGEEKVAKLKIQLLEGEVENGRISITTTRERRSLRTEKKKRRIIGSQEDPAVCQWGISPRTCKLKKGTERGGKEGEE